MDSINNQFFINNTASPTSAKAYAKNDDIGFAQMMATRGSVDGLSGAAKSGTAQKGKIELAWIMCFAPAENPQIALAVIMEGDEGQNFGGGANSGPVAHAILSAWKEKRDRPPPEKPLKFSAQ